MTQAHGLHQKGWHVPLVADILALVDLPRHIWGPAYVLHVMGIYAAGKGLQASGASAVLFRRLLALNWRQS